MTLTETLKGRIGAAYTAKAKATAEFARVSLAVEMDEAGGAELVKAARELNSCEKRLVELQAALVGAEANRPSSRSASGQG